MSVADNLRQLESCSPAVGLVIKNDGTEINYADLYTGKGIAVMDHDSSMLELGYSRTAEVWDIDLGVGEYLYLELTVKPDVIHHVESRIVEAYGGEARFCVVPNYTGAVSGTPSRLPIWNQKGAELIPEIDQLSYFNYWAPQGSNPLDFDPFLPANADKRIDPVTLYAESGGFFTASTSDAFASAKGRHYYAGRQGVLIYAVEACTVSYKYNYHNFSNNG